MDRVLVTGGTGFLGRVVTTELYSRGYSMPWPVGAKRWDLRVREDAMRLVETLQPTTVVHLAAVVGGIEANRMSPGGFFRDNVLMGVNILDACVAHKVQKVVVAGTVCSYPKVPPRIPFVEADLWAGYPEETNAPYGIAKRAVLTMLQAYRAEYGLNGVMVIPTNLYGPNDSLDRRKNHVIPALVKVFVDAAEAKQPSVTLWGTGAPTREFLYVDDAARGIVDALLRYDSQEPINIGGGEEISIAALAEKIAHIVGYTGEILWDATAPDGQPRRAIDCSAARAAINWKPQVSLDEGLRRTVVWYRQATTPHA
jgi:nucleoside-diphosphate-sugar epimerase